MGWYVGSDGRRWSSESYTIVYPADNLSAPLGEKKPEKAAEPAKTSIPEAPKAEPAKSIDSSAPILAPASTYEAPKAESKPETKPEPEPKKEEKPEAKESTAITQVIPAVNEKHSKHRLLAIITSILLVLSVILVSFTLLLIPALTHSFATRTEVANYDLGISKGQLIQIADDTRDYIAGRDAVLPTGYDFQRSYTPDVVSHLDDVAKMIMYVRIVAAAVLALLLICMIRYIALSKKNKNTLYGNLIKRQEGNVMLVSGLIVLVIMAVLAAIAAIDFYSFFGVLHSLFFSDGTWTFSASSLIIQVYPEKFWMAMGISWAAMAAIFAIILIDAGATKKRHNRKLI